MAQTDVIDWFATARIIDQLVHPTTVCTCCGEPVRSHPVYESSTSVRYVLPVDEHGWCPSCAQDRS